MAPPSGRMLPAEAASRRALRVALLGNPNTGKTTLFNRLCGIRARTANYPGITADARVGTVGGGAARRIEITDLPGTYGLSLDLPEARLCRGILTGELGEERRPDALLLVLDAANLGRNLVLGAEALALGLPAVIALNMIDVAHRQGIGIDASRLEKGLGCPVVTLNSRSGEGLGALLEALEHPAPCRAPPQNGGSAPALKQWADEQARRCVREESRAEDGGRTATDRLDALVTHRFLGPLIFLAVMAGLFTVIFSLATIP
ncbi:MAG: FeoB small GTPase domain-containing protein, partial [Planctomycetota bacterium]